LTPHGGTLRFGRSRLVSARHQGSAPSGAVIFAREPKK
jgi:hypothetical protein